ncbi:ABC transporter ATP-binding protein [Pseudonocardia sp. CA-107938]|uniref:ABC transporter ATP-binding protein n=1 Tax=Pseudonocardia sp. CA-107938 TaxID=3240021 RepID=UPI003D938392
MAGMITGSRVLRDAVGSQRRQVGLSGLLMCGHQAGEALVPVLVGVVIDAAVATGDVGALLFWIAVLGVDFLFLSWSYRFGARVAKAAEQRMDQRLRLQVADRVLDPHGGAETGRLPGSLVNLATSDTFRVAVMGFVLPMGAAAVVALAVGTVALLRISVPLGLLILLGTPPLLYAVHLLGKPLERRSGPEQERAALASGVAADLVAGVRVLKGIGAEPVAVRRYRRTSRDALGATLRATRAQARFDGAVLAINGLFLALIALVGGRMAAEGTISVGELVSAVGLAQFLVGPLEMFGEVMGWLAMARASAVRVADVLAAAPAVGAGDRPAPAQVTGALRLRGLAHGPLPALDLDVPAGEIVGVVPADPAAATALMRLLAREVDPEGGTVELDGVALTAYPPQAARAAVVVSAHDAELFAGTLWENVAAGGDAVATAMAAARADQVAEALPDGVETAITEQGRSLSGGQRQRVALARALATGAPVLVLHDPTTAVDAVTEAEIAEGLRAHRAGRTTLLLTTSPALLAVTDRVVLLDTDGTTTAGDHAALLDSARYREVVLR